VAAQRLLHRQAWRVCLKPGHEDFPRGSGPALMWPPPGDSTGDGRPHSSNPRLRDYAPPSSSKAPGLLVVKDGPHCIPVDARGRSKRRISELPGQGRAGKSHNGGCLGTQVRRPARGVSWREAKNSANNHEPSGNAQNFQRVAALIGTGAFPDMIQADARLSP